MTTCGIKTSPCGEPVANQRTPADRYDEEFPDSMQDVTRYNGCGDELPEIADLAA